NTHPSPLANYPSFVAEVASTFNETLLINHVLEHEGRRHAAVSVGELSREHQEHGISPGAVCRVRTPDVRNGGKGATHHRQCTGEAVSGYHAEVLWPGSGHLDRRRLHRQRVELHPALLPRLLRISIRHVIYGLDGPVGKSDRRRSRRHQTLSRIPERRRLEVPHRSSQRCRRRYAHRRTAG